MLLLPYKNWRLYPSNEIKNKKFTLFLGDKRSMKKF